MKVEVYHNLSRDASFGLNTVFVTDRTTERGYRKEQQPLTHMLVKVFEYEVEETDPESLLAEAWETFNVGTNGLAQAYWDRRLRSLSVGDVVVLGNEAYSVEPTAGYQPRSFAELRIKTDAATAEDAVRSLYRFAPGEQLSVTVPWVASA